MESYKFNFFEENASGPKSNEATDKIKWFEAKQVEPDFNLAARVRECGTLVSFTHDSGVLNYLITDLTRVLDKTLESTPFLIAERNHSDLVPGVYEGGSKIWDCTWDLIKFISAENLNFQSKNVLDLGCGSGIVGILAYQNRANVCFQDYNEEIVKCVTIPNVFLNSVDADALSVCTFYCGDWQSFAEKCSQKFDYIFTCETIYNPSNYKKLHNVFRNCLKADGVIYLAAKTHYFGVGGGTSQFQEFVCSENVFDSSVSWSSLNGLKTQILKITFKNNY